MGTEHAKTWDVKTYWSSHNLKLLECKVDEAILCCRSSSKLIGEIYHRTPQESQLHGVFSCTKVVVGFSQ